MPNLCSTACSELCALLHGEEIELAVGGFGSSVTEQCSMTILSTSLLMFDFYAFFYLSTCCTLCSGADTCFLFSLRLRSRRCRVETSQPEKHCLRLPICFVWGGVVGCGVLILVVVGGSSNRLL